MSEKLLKIVADPPDVWGEGTLFAFSGLDGATCSLSSFVGSLWSPRYDILFHLKQPRRLCLRVTEPSVTEICTSDVLSVRTPSGPMVVTWAAWHTLVGLVPNDGKVELKDDASEDVGTWGLTRPVGGGGQQVVLLKGERGRFSLGFGVTAEEASRRAGAGLTLDPGEVAADRLHGLRLLRRRADDYLCAATSPTRTLSRADSRLLNKCLSVMRVNALSGEGCIRQTWSTPDRIPHRHMWLWDSVFHAMAMSALDPNTAWCYLKSVMDFAGSDGLIPITMCVDGAKVSDMTQPPVLAWAVWWNYLFTRDKFRLGEALPKIDGYLRWNMNHRDRNGNCLLEWFIEDSPVCRCGESGMDNSPRFDSAKPVDSVDFSAFQAHEMWIASLMARELDKQELAKYWEDQYKAVSAKIHGYLWDPSRGFYVDRDMDGRFTGVEASSGFVPLLLGNCPGEHTNALVKALRDPNRFGTPAPIPSLARKHPAFSSDMWRGPMWSNYNFLIAMGLRRQGATEMADLISAKTVETVRKYYESSGVLFEYYDSSDERSPAACDRKGKRAGAYLSRPYGDAVRDYHWTAALTACHILGIDGDWLRLSRQPSELVESVSPKKRALKALTKGVSFDLFEPANAVDSARGEFPAASTEDLKWWRDGRVGMFVHWNMSCIRPCTISWGMNYGSVMPDEYYDLAKRFNPRKFDAMAWAEMIKGCGFANLLFVVKHHDSFAMWDTKQSDMKITNTPYGRDLWRELTDACHKVGLPIGGYYSPADWLHPAARRGDWPKYCKFMRAQWVELFSNYGRLDTFECDYWQNFCRQDDWETFYKDLRRIQPHVLFSRNTAWARGDFEVHEWSVGEMTYDGMPPGPPPHKWSSMPDNTPWCSLMSVDGRKWWSFNPDPCVGFDRMMAWVLSSVLNDGNILCNFTPGPSGEFPADQVRLMTSFGDWMKVYGESIRGTRGGPYLPLTSYDGLGEEGKDGAPVMLSNYNGQKSLVPKVGSTRKGNRVYLHILGRVPGDRLELPGIVPSMRKAWLLSDPGAPVTFAEKDGKVALRVPPFPENTPDMVIVLEFSGSVMDTKPVRIA